MLRFVLDVLLLRDLIQSRTGRTIALLFFIGTASAGIIYGCIVLSAISKRSLTPHVHKHSSR
jgi:hypothetical protein